MTYRLIEGKHRIADSQLSLVGIDRTTSLQHIRSRRNKWIVED